MTDPIFTPAELAEIHAYHRPYYVWAAVNFFVNVGVSVLMLRFLVRPLYARCERVKIPSKVLARMWRGDSWAAALIFSSAYHAIGTLLYLPADLYFEFVHEQAYGMSNYTAANYAIDSVKQFGIVVWAMSAVTFGLLGLARRVRLWWALLGAIGAVLMLFSAALDPYRARIYFEQKPLPAGELRDRITALMAKAQIDFRDVLVEDNDRTTVRLQAYFAGRGPTRTIVLNEALLKNLTPEEILAAVAHEAGHVHEPRWPAMIASSLALIAFLFGVDRVLRWVQRRGWWGVTEYADVRALPLVLLVFALCSAAVAPFSAAVSRERERKADVYGLELTRNADAFTAMLVKAARVNKMDPDPPYWLVLKGRSHPPVRERLELVEAWKKTNGG